MYEFSEDTKQQFYKSFKRTEKDVNNDVEIIKTWIKSQPHLPEIMEDAKIKNFLNLNKFSIEKTKQKIDMYYTIRSVIPDIFERSNPKLDNIKQLFETTYVITLPTLLNKTHRVYFVRPKKPNILNPIDVICLWFAIFEIRLYEDFMVDDVLIVDLTHCTLSDIKEITPTILTKFVTVYKKVYTLRLKKFIYFNCPSFISTYAAVVKSLFKEKLLDRIEFHEGDAVLKKILPKELLPKDYGGEGKSLDELSEMLKRKLEEYQDRFDKLDELKVHENLRPEKLNNDEILGFYGNFKKIDVD